MQRMRPLRSGVPVRRVGAATQRSEQPRLPFRLYGAAGEVHRLHELRYGVPRRVHRGVSRENRLKP